MALYGSLTKIEASSVFQGRLVHVQNFHVFREAGALCPWRVVILHLRYPGYFVIQTQPLLPVNDKYSFVPDRRRIFVKKKTRVMATPLDHC